MVCWKNLAFLFDQSNNTDATDKKMSGSALEEKSYFKTVFLF